MKNHQGRSALKGTNSQRCRAVRGKIKTLDLEKRDLTVKGVLCGPVKYMGRGGWQRGTGGTNHGNVDDNTQWGGRKVTPSKVT